MGYGFVHCTFLFETHKIIVICFVTCFYSDNNGQGVAVGSTSDDIYDFDRCAREGFIFYQNEDSREGTVIFFTFCNRMT